MRAHIDIGTDSGGADVCVDVEELLATRLLVQGNSGSGKSHLLRRLLEQSAGLVQQIVIDPEGDFVSLADRYDHVIIDAGAYSPREIEALAARVRQHRVSVVLALEELEVEQQIRCAALFLTALFDAPREHWFPALVVVDEAQMFAPSAAGDMAEDTRRLTLSAMTNLMCRGRKRGLAGIVATQRLAKLAKNVAAEASNFLMGRTFLDIDMQRAADLLGMDRRQAERIRDLQRGQFLGLGPAISRRPVAVRIGAVETRSGSTSSGLLPLPTAQDEDLHSLLTEQLAADAARPAAPPAPLLQRASDLERQIAERKVSLPEPVEPPLAKAANDSGERKPLMNLVEPDSAPDDAITRIVRALANEEGAALQSSTALFRSFALRCRREGVASAHIDVVLFRRMFAHAIAGFDALDPKVRDAIGRLAENVPEDMLAPYLTLAAASAEGREAGEDEIARAYGSSSPSRIRRMLDHLERQGLIVVREDFGGARSISIAGLERAA